MDEELDRMSRTHLHRLCFPGSLYLARPARPARPAGLPKGEGGAISAANLIPLTPLANEGECAFRGAVPSPPRYPYEHMFTGIPALPFLGVLRLGSSEIRRCQYQNGQEGHGWLCWVA